MFLLLTDVTLDFKEFHLMFELQFLNEDIVLKTKTTEFLTDLSNNNSFCHNILPLSSTITWKRELHNEDIR